MTANKINQALTGSTHHNGSHQPTAARVGQGVVSSQIQAQDKSHDKSYRLRGCSGKHFGPKHAPIGLIRASQLAQALSPAVTTPTPHPWAGTSVRVNPQARNHRKIRGTVPSGPAAASMWSGVGTRRSGHVPSVAAVAGCLRGRVAADGHGFPGGSGPSRSWQ